MVIVFSRYGIGATTVGLKCSEGVVLASEKRIAYAGYIMSRSGRKVFKITDRLGVAFAGLFADMQALTRIIAAEIRFYELTYGRKMTVRSAAKILSNVLYSQRALPYMSEVLVGGIDDTGPHLFVLDSLGSVLEDDYAAIGSGAPIAIGIIESAYTDKIDIKRCEELAVEAIRRAVARDSISGCLLYTSPSPRDRG